MLTSPSPDVPAAYRVLIVDDDEDMRILLNRALCKTPLPLEVEVAVDGQEALDFVSRQWLPHLVVTDIMMPRIDGFELCALLRANPLTATIPIVMLTALEDEEHKAHSLRVGANDYLTKSSGYRDLTGRLLQLLEQRYGRSQGNRADSQ